MKHLEKLKVEGVLRQIQRFVGHNRKNLTLLLETFKKMKIFSELAGTKRCQNFTSNRPTGYQRNIHTSKKNLRYKTKPDTGLTFLNQFNLKRNSKQFNYPM